MQFQRGQIVTVRTTAMVPPGVALGRLPEPDAAVGTGGRPHFAEATRGRPVFVRGGAPDEEAEVRLTRIKQDFAEAQFVRATKPSPDRINSAFAPEALAGANWHYLRYEAQLRAKEAMIAELLQKIGHLPIDTFQVSGVRCPIVGAPAENQWRYRNKVELTFGFDADDKVALGFHAPGRFDQIIPTTDIALFPEVGQAIIRAVVDWANREKLTVWQPRRNPSTSLRIPEPGSASLRNLVLRRAEHGSDLVINLVTTPGKIPVESLKAISYQLQASGLVWTENASAATIVRADSTHLLAGSDTITETFLGTPIRYHVDSFFQTHTLMAEKLAATLLERLSHIHLRGKNQRHEISSGSDVPPDTLHLRGEDPKNGIYSGSDSQPNVFHLRGVDRRSEISSGSDTPQYPFHLRGVRGGVRVIDGYAGVGGFGLLAARAGAHVASIESHEPSIADARRNAAQLGVLDRMEFIHQPMEDYLKSPAPSYQSPAPVLIVDPPRAGLHPKVAKAIAESSIQRMFYVSCNPATLARDLAVLYAQPSSLHPIFIQCFDLFPQTSHVETLVELVRVE